MSFSSFDHECMARALCLARHGLNSTRPNPRVGCVISRDGKIVGEGWHQKAGQAHAEIIALEAAGACSSGTTAYVTLEPCSHTGRTSPCCDALIAAGVSRVICAGQDPNPVVNGRGISRLSEAGIEVVTGLMENEARALNRGFYCRHEKGRPWVRVKLATSLDGRTALSNGTSQWITGTAARRDVQRWRARSCAILTGIGTVLADDPSLNVRDVDIVSQPLRVVADSHFRSPADARLFQLEGDVLIAGLSEHLASFCGPSSCQTIGLDDSEGRVDLAALLASLADRGINEVHVEAGSELSGALLNHQLVDEILWYQAPILLGDKGLPAFTLNRLETMSQKVEMAVKERVMVGQDLRLRLQPQY